MKRSIAILGATGLLGQMLTRKARARGLSVTTVARKNAEVALDIREDAALAAFCREGRFDVVVNCCAIVNHTYCDEHPGEAYLLNARPSALLASLAKECSFRYVYISTDGYFNGDRDAKHAEDAPVSFLNEYARTKWLGERFAMTNPESLVVRTNIVGFRGIAGQPTFFEWVLQSLQAQAKMTLFDDYFTSSISTAQFADVFFDLLKKDVTGLYNLAASEVSSKRQFVECVSRVFGLPLNHPTIGSVASLASKRADSLGLDVSKVEQAVGYAMPKLEAVVRTLRDEHLRI